MLWFFLLMMVTTCFAGGAYPPPPPPPACTSTQNLEGKVYIFPKDSSTDYVKLISSVHSFTKVTVCLRVKTDLCRDHVLFSAATSYVYNAFVIFWDASEEAFDVQVNDVSVLFKGLRYNPNKWHSICVTWDASNGLVQLWIDGHYTAPEFSCGGHINYACILVGQEQDSYCGSFDEQQSFVGEITDVHMWDHVINVCEIQHYMDFQNFCPGNAINWRVLTAELHGQVKVAPYQICLKESRPKSNECVGGDYFYYSNNPNTHGKDCCAYGDYYRSYSDDYRYYQNAYRYIKHGFYFTHSHH